MTPHAGLRASAATGGRATFVAQKKCDHVAADAEKILRNNNIITCNEQHLSRDVVEWSTTKALAMARILRTGDTPAKTRRAHMRSCAEVLRLLAQRAEFDDEAKDMTAFVVFNLRGIYRTIDDSAQAWDKRNYWKKAEQLRHQWRWSSKAADHLESLIKAERWTEVAPALIALVPHFSSISVTSITRNADWWCGARRALLHGDHS